jgi:NAD(P)-dependent dehydrogenase (short-subunit alcohol dehydrogenase family)
MQIDSFSELIPEVNSMQLKDKVAVVTGGSRSIGKAIAQSLADKGALVAVNYAGNQAAADATVQELEAAGGKAFAVKGDIGSLADIEKLFAVLDVEFQKRTGSSAIDILVNNAGVIDFATVADSSEEVFDRVFAVNVKGTYFVTQQALKRMRDGGRILNISSSAARVPEPAYGAYSMSKGTIEVFTKTLAKELGPRNITVNALAPGWIETDLNRDFWKNNPEIPAGAARVTALGRTGTVSDVAGVATFLVSPEAGFLTGQIIEVSGGYHI